MSRQQKVLIIRECDECIHIGGPDYNGPMGEFLMHCLHDDFPHKDSWIKHNDLFHPDCPLEDAEATPGEAAQVD